MRPQDHREAAVIGEAARHLAALRFNRPGGAPKAAARIIDELRRRNLLRAERALSRL